MRALWNFARLDHSGVLLFPYWNDQTSLFTKSVGIACPTCFTEFKVVQTRIRIVRALTWGSLFTCAALFGSWDRRVHLILNQRLELGVLATLVALLYWLHFLLTPYLALVRRARDGEILICPLKAAYQEPASSSLPPVAVPPAASNTSLERTRDG